MVRFTLRQCVYFRAVALHGGIAQAARALNISQPSVAQAIDKLEDTTRLVLFERHHARGLSLTMQGRLFLQHVIRLDDLAHQVEREAAALAAGAAGEIRLGVFLTLSPFYAAGLIRSFTNAVPTVTVRQKEMPLSQLADALREGSIDFALTYDDGVGADDLLYEELAVLEPMVVVSTDHPLAACTSVELDRLRDQPYVMFDAPGSRAYFEGLLAKCGIAPPIAYSSSSMEGVRSAVAAGFGFTLLVMRPPSPVTYDGREVTELAIQNDLPPLRVVLASRPDGHSGRVAQRFVEHARAWFARKAAGGPPPRIS